MIDLWTLKRKPFYNIRHKPTGLLLQAGPSGLWLWSKGNTYRKPPKLPTEPLRVGHLVEKEWVVKEIPPQEWEAIKITHSVTVEVV